jgi:hypothetical protein
MLTIARSVRALLPKRSRRWRIGRQRKFISILLRQREFSTNAFVHSKVSVCPLRRAKDQFHRFSTPKNGL